MDFDYEIEKDGEIIKTLKCEAEFAPIIRGRYEGRPEHCYPDEGGEFQNVTVRLDGRRLTEKQVDEMFGEGTWSDIEKYAADRRRMR
jgi:hypothetical protein